MIGHLIIQPLMFLGVFFFFRTKRGLFEIDEYYIKLYTENNKDAKEMLEDFPFLLTNVIIKYKIFNLIFSKCFLYKNIFFYLIIIKIQYVYLFNCFQNVILLFIFNINSKHRKYFYSNKLYIFYISLIGLFFIDFIAMMNPIYNKFMDEKFVFLDNFEKINTIDNESNRLYLIVFITCNAVVSYLWEILFEVFTTKDSDKNGDK